MIFSDRSIDIYGRIALLRKISGPENRPDRRFFLSEGDLLVKPLLSQLKGLKIATPE